MLKITAISSDRYCPFSSDAIMVPVGYINSPTAFETTAVDVMKYLKENNFNVDILSTPETFSTIELNSNLIRLGKFVLAPMYYGFKVFYYQTS